MLLSQREIFHRYQNLLKSLNMPYPVPEDRRAELDKKIGDEYYKITKRESSLPASQRYLIINIVRSYENTKPSEVVAAL